MLILRRDVAVPPNIQFKEEWVDTHLLEGSDIIVFRRDVAVQPNIQCKEEWVDTHFLERFRYNSIKT